MNKEEWFAAHRVGVPPLSDDQKRALWAALHDEHGQVFRRDQERAS